MIVATSGAQLLPVGSLVFLAIIGLGALSIFVRTIASGVAPMPSSLRVQVRMVALVRGLEPRLQGKPKRKVVELGSGWGNLSIALSRTLPYAEVIGYEISPVPYWFSLAARGLFRRGNLRFERKDFHTISLEDADVIVCYLSPDAMERLRQKFSVELKPAALVVSSTFAMASLHPLRIDVVDDIYRTRIYVYSGDSCRSDPSGRLIDVQR